MIDDTPKFLLASDADRASWRDMPMSKWLLEWLEGQLTRVEDGILAHVRAHKTTEAERLDGKREAVEELLMTIWHRSPHASAPAEDDFIDPATRPSTLAKGK